MLDGNTALLAAPALAGAGALGWWGWTHARKQRFQKELDAEIARRKELLGGGAALRPSGELWRRAKGRGQIPILAVGTYAAKQLPGMLQAFVRAGCGDFVGEIYLLELADAERQACLALIPAEFRGRIVEAVCPHFPDGLGGVTLGKAWGHENRSRWLPDVEDGATEWLARVERNTTPALLLTLLSPGGMAAPGRPVIERFHERYPHLPIYVVSIIDHKTVRRERFPEIRKFYNQGGLIRGWIVTDNRRDHRRADLGIAVLLAAMVAGTWVTVLSEPPLNGLADVFPEELPAGGVATISVFGELLPIYYLPPWRNVLPEAFFTQAPLFEEKSMRGIKAVAEHPERQSLPLEKAEPGSTRLCYVIAPIVPDPDLRTSANRIERGIEPWRVTTDIDLLVQYASLGAPMDATTTETPMVVVLLQRIQEAESVDDLALGAAPDPKFLPRPSGGFVIDGTEATLSEPQVQEEVR